VIGSGADDWQEGTEEKYVEMAKLKPDRKKHKIHRS